MNDMKKDPTEGMSKYQRKQYRLANEKGFGTEYGEHTVPALSENEEKTVESLKVESLKAKRQELRISADKKKRAVEFHSTALASCTVKLRKIQKDLEALDKRICKLEGKGGER